MSILRIKQDLIDQSLQVALLDLDGNLLDSDHTLIDLRASIGKDLFGEMDALFGLKDGVMNLTPGGEPLLLPIISFKVAGKDILLNLEIYRREQDYLLILINNDLVLSRLRDMQQERNDSMILLERIRKQDAALKETNQQLKSANDELDKFAYIVSHDLKTPLRGIRNLSDWIAEGIDSGDHSEIAEQVSLLKERSLRMEQMIDAILEYSRAGRVVLPARKVNVNTLVEDALSAADPEKSVTLLLPAPLPIIVTQVNWLNQVLSKLISNSVQYGKPEEGVAQELRIVCQELPEHYQFTFSDNGPGIPKEHQQRVFEVFETLGDQQSTRRTGIGLSVAKKLIEKAGGKIWIEDEAQGDDQEQTGATISFTWAK